MALYLGIACASPSQTGHGGHQGGGQGNYGVRQANQGVHQKGDQTTGQMVQEKPQAPIKPYIFAYGVNGDKQGGSFGQQEVSDGTTVKGSYVVNLPDGRQQVVSYTADKENGFQADVSYVGEARYPAAQVAKVSTNGHQIPQNNLVKGASTNQNPQSGQPAQQVTHTKTTHAVHPHQNQQVIHPQTAPQVAQQPQSRHIVQPHHIQGIVLPHQLHQIVQTQLGPKIAHPVPVQGAQQIVVHPNQGYVTNHQNPQSVYTDDKTQGGHQGEQGGKHEAHNTNQKAQSEGDGSQSQEGQSEKGNEGRHQQNEGARAEDKNQETSKTHQDHDGGQGGHGQGEEKGHSNQGDGGHGGHEGHGHEDRGHGGREEGGHHGGRNHGGNQGDGDYGYEDHGYGGQKEELGSDYDAPNEDYNYGSSSDHQGEEDFFGDHGGFGGFANRDNRLGEEEPNTAFSDIVYETERDRSFFRNKYSPTKDELKELERH